MVMIASARVLTADELTASAAFSAVGGLLVQAAAIGTEQGQILGSARPHRWWPRHSAQDLNAGIVCGLLMVIWLALSRMMQALFAGYLTTVTVAGLAGIMGAGLVSSERGKYLRSHERNRFAVSHLVFAATLPCAVGGFRLLTDSWFTAVTIGAMSSWLFTAMLLPFVRRGATSRPATYADAQPDAGLASSLWGVGASLALSAAFVFPSVLLRMHVEAFDVESVAQAQLVGSLSRFAPAVTLSLVGVFASTFRLRGAAETRRQFVRPAWLLGVVSSLGTIAIAAPALRLLRPTDLRLSLLEIVAAAAPAVILPPLVLHTAMALAADRARRAALVMVASLLLVFALDVLFSTDLQTSLLLILAGALLMLGFQRGVHPERSVDT